MSAIPVSVKTIKTTGLPADKRKKRIILRRSSYLITMNTNAKPLSYAAIQIGKNDLEHAGELVFSAEHLPLFVDFNKAGHSWTPQFIKSAHTENAAELGRTQRGARLHMHAYLVIEHYSNIKLNHNHLKQEMNNALEHAGSTYRIHYVSIRFTGDVNAPREYVEKDIMEEESAPA